MSTSPATSAAAPTPPAHTDQPNWSGYNKFAVVAAVAGWALFAVVGFANLGAAEGEQAKHDAAARFFTAYLSGWVYWLSLPVGALALLMIRYVAKTSWGLLLTRPFEAATRTLPLTIAAGVLVSQYVELTAAPAVNTGRLDITSDPPGAQVSVDGIARGVTPLTLDAIDAREHAITLTRAGATVLRKVKVTPGATASVFAALGTTATPGAVGGYIALSVPFEVQVLEEGLAAVDDRFQLGHRCSHFGRRFSTKALTPSAASSDLSMAR